MKEKLYLFSGLIMAGLRTNGVKPLDEGDFQGNNDETDNDGSVIMRRIESFLRKKRCSSSKVDKILGLLKPVFMKQELWESQKGVSVLRRLYLQVKAEVIPYLESSVHLDFTGKIMNSLNDRVKLEGDHNNDVVLTPWYVTSFMARLCRTNMNSFVWDRAMGTAGFLVSAMDIMIRDAKDRIKDQNKLAEKIKNIKEKKLFGIELKDEVYILAVLNMILMGDGSSNMVCGDSHKWRGSFDADVFLLNPPYSAEGKGFVFVEEALGSMKRGYAAVLIQESAGAGQGEGCTERILKNNTLIASIHIPEDLFLGKAAVQTAVYVFKVNQPHDRQVW